MANGGRPHHKDCTQIITLVYNESVVVVVVVAVAIVVF